MNDIVKKPGTVPADALWNESTGEWELGKKNNTGQQVGEWKWWLAPSGHLVCRTYFDDAGQMLSFKRFHPNGEVSQYGIVGANGNFTERAHIRSSEKTSEIFPVQAEDAWKVVPLPGMPISYEYYDRHGNLINGIFEIPGDMKIGFDQLEPIKAIEKITEVIDYAVQGLGKSYTFFEEKCKPTFTDTVAKEDISQAEKRLGIIFPPSYTEFVLKYGLFKIGTTLDDNFQLQHPSKIVRLTDILDEQADVDWDNCPEDKKIAENMISFCSGDENMQWAWSVCFDLNNVDPKTGEADIFLFDMQVLDIDESWLIEGIYKRKVSAMQTHLEIICEKIIEDIDYALE